MGLQALLSDLMDHDQLGAVEIEQVIWDGQGESRAVADILPGPFFMRVALRLNADHHVRPKLAHAVNGQVVEDAAVDKAALADWHRRKQARLQPNPAQFPASLPGHVLEALHAYDWPGNVRELQNMLQRYLATQHLDLELPLRAAPAQETRQITESPLNLNGIPLPEALKEFEKQMIVAALAQNQQHKINTAKMLGIPRSTLHRKIKEYQIQDAE